ncbi:hypothetical protein Tco_0106231, partial [Tanacetum coccineum]
WCHVRKLIGMQSVAPVMDDILAWLIPISKLRSIRSMLPKLVLAASTYFIWQELNSWIFKMQKRSKEQVIEVSISTVWLKLPTFRFKKSRRMDSMLENWHLPRFLVHDGG